MNHRERILAAIRHQPVDRVPTDMWATPEVLARLFAHLGIADRSAAGAPEDAGQGIGLLGNPFTYDDTALVALWDRLDIDGILTVAPPYIGPALRQAGEISFDEWGMGTRRQEYGTGSYRELVVHPLAAAETVADLEAYRWPDPAWYDYAALPGLAERFPGRAVCCGYTAPFYYHNLLRGLELSLTDPILRPDFTRCLLARLSDLFTEYHRRCFQALRGLVDITQVTDDFGSQQSLLISPRIFDQFYRGPMQRAIDLAKSFGLIVFHHDDGDMRPLLSRLVEMGIDVLNPIQWRCGGWDLRALKAQYGGRICFHSAVDNQQTLPFGTPDDVRREVKWLIETLADDRTGFIVGPCHNLQPVTPTVNILALYEAAREYGCF